MWSWKGPSTIQLEMKLEFRGNGKKNEVSWLTILLPRLKPFGYFCRSIYEVTLSISIGRNLMCAQIRFNSACTEISVPIMLSRYDPSSSANNQDKKEQLSEVLLPLDYYYYKKKKEKHRAKCNGLSKCQYMVTTKKMEENYIPLTKQNLEKLRAKQESISFDVRFAMFWQVYDRLACIISMEKENSSMNAHTE